MGWGGEQGGRSGLGVEEELLHALSAGGGTIRQVTSEVFALQEVGPLQHLDVALVDLERRAEADGQTGQHVAALHQEQRLPVNLLVKTRFVSLIMLQRSKSEMKVKH